MCVFTSFFDVQIGLEKMKPSLMALCISVSSLVVTPVMAQSSATSSGQLLSQSNPLTLLIEQALANDASRKQFYAQSQAMRETGVAATTLMDPNSKSVLVVCRSIASNLMKMR